MVIIKITVHFYLYLALILTSKLLCQGRILPDLTELFTLILEQKLPCNIRIINSQLIQTVSI